MAGSTSPRAVRRLRAACEQAKRMLATGTTASTDLDSLVEFNGLSEIPNFRMGFNSLGGAASVKNFHLQCYQLEYFQHESDAANVCGSDGVMTLGRDVTLVLKTSHRCNNRIILPVLPRLLRRVLRISHRYNNRILIVGAKYCPFVLDFFSARNL